MNDTIINRVKGLLKLNETILDVLKGYEILVSEDNDEVPDPEIVNNELLECFLKAKELEGYSEQTIHYYRRILNSLNSYLKQYWMLLLMMYEIILVLIRNGVIVLIVH